MTTLPRVTIRPEGTGWTAECSCGWIFWQPQRLRVDREAHQHRAKCATRKEDRE